MVAAAYGGVNWLAIRIDVEGKALWTATGWACVAAGRVGVFL